METFLLGLIFGVAIGVWISVAIIEWRLPESKPAPMPQPAPAPPRQPAKTAAAPTPSAGPQPVSSAAQPPSQPVGATTWAPVSQRPTEPNQPVAELSPKAQQLYDQLLDMAQGDRAKADRLVAFERSKSPAASTDILIGNAIDRWLHDNR